MGLQPQQAVAHFSQTLGSPDLRRTPLLRTDVLVIGSGIAGATAALHAASNGAEVLLLTKDGVQDTNTAWAQGGIAAVLEPQDSSELHVADTLRVGAGLADPDRARAIISRSRDSIDWLQALGAHFDAGPDGLLALSHEGGHSARRVVHAHGDSTGAEIQRALSAALAAASRVTLHTGAFVRDLLVHEGHCVGALALVDGMSLAVEAGAVIIATGGSGQIYRETTNPPGASGDGIALCFRAGARLADMEFVQFHPTTLYIAGASRFLISEVVRGAGAVLRDRNGERFMLGIHPKAELAPRDVVSRAILERMVQTGDTHVYLDLATVAGDPHALFPSISRICRSYDLDIAREPIPVRPGAHYMIGGVETSLDGSTNVPGLLAVGETASTGLHGANRLASNSLLEGVVVGQSAGSHAAEMSRQARPGLPRRLPGLAPVDNPPRILHEDLLYSLKSLMWRQVGLRRERPSLLEARDRIAFWYHYLVRAPIPDRRSCELVNMLTVAALVTEAALQREESRGTHARTDRPERDDEKWCRHIALCRSPDGAVRTELGPLAQPTDGGAN